MTNTEQIFNMVLAFLGKHGIPVGGLSLLGDVVLRSGEKFDMLWASIDGGGRSGARLSQRVLGVQLQVRRSYARLPATRRHGGMGGNGRFR
jgi:hypothetical protein